MAEEVSVNYQIVTYDVLMTAGHRDDVQSQCPLHRNCEPIAGLLLLTL